MSKIGTPIETESRSARAWGCGLGGVGVTANGYEVFFEVTEVL